VSVENHILVFGGRGAIGAAVCRRFADLSWRVTGTSRRCVQAAAGDPVSWLACDPLMQRPSLTPAAPESRYTAVCWAQGANSADSVFDVDTSKHLELYQTNCVFVLETLRILLNGNLLAPGARLVVVSSIWQRIARQDKLSYIMSKAAVGGLVRSAAVDLAKSGFLINAVLPSVLDTVMTRSNLDAAQIDDVASATGFGRLNTLEDVVGAIQFLCSKQNTGITGQSLVVDLGFSHARIV
jgi:3-oxoacyl-[acyl-carrier protein] reductase